jgi:hypothetical protein
VSVPGAYGVAVAPATRQLELYPVTGHATVEQERRLIVQVVDHDIHAPIAVNVCEGRSTGDLQYPVQSPFAHFAEAPVSQILEELIALPVCLSETLAFNLGIDVPVGDEDIKHAIVIEIDKSRTPFQEIPAGRSES